MKFKKVSLEQFVKDYIKANNIYPPSVDDDMLLDIRDIYSKIKLPQRATRGSAGYDFYIPYTVNFSHITGPVTIPTGIRFQCDDDKYLMLVPRSGCGFKHGLRLRNTCGTIDCDYYNSSNEGHIMAKFTCEEPFTLEQGVAMMQGIILPFYKVEDDNVDKERNGGFGSTGM